ETGRQILWPAAIERIFASPFIGVGASNVNFEMSPGKIMPSHNSFLFFALSSGLIPFAFYLAFWVRAAWKSFSDLGRSEYAPFRLPLLLYAFVNYILGDITIVPWALLALTVGAGPAISQPPERVPRAWRIGSPR